MNNVGLSHFLMKGCGLPRDKLDHIMLLVNNDRRRYHDIKQHLMKMGKVTQPSQAPGHFGYYQDDWGASGWNDDGWNEQSWDCESWDETTYWGEADWYDTQESWTNDDWQTPWDESLQWPQQPQQTNTSEQNTTKARSAEEVNYGKGPGQGGCSVCGGPGHSTENCLLGKTKGK